MSDALEPVATRPVGRPSEYDPAYCERVIELGREGKSRAEIASALDCSRVTLWSWEKTYPEFMSALQRAKDEELAWWEAKSREGIDKGSAFNATLWGRAVSGRFPSEPYRERHEVAGPNGGPIQTEDVGELAALPRSKRDAIRAAIVAAMGEGGS